MSATESDVGFGAKNKERDARRCLPCHEVVVVRRWGRKDTNSKHHPPQLNPLGTISILFDW